MTIIRRAYRMNGGPEELMCEGPQSLDEALVSMLKFEYGYGGRPTVIRPTRVATFTTVLNCRDRTVWEGSEEEMRPLVLVSRAFLDTLHPEVNHVLAETLAPKLHEASGGNAFLVSGLAPLFAGGARLRMLCLLLCSDFSDAAVARAKSMDIEDVVPVVTLAHETGRTFSEVCEELGV